MLNTYCFCDFLVYGLPLHDEEKHDVIVPEKDGIQFTDKEHTNLGNL